MAEKTDKELAVAIGRLVLDSQLRIGALEYLLSEAGVALWPARTRDLVRSETADREFQEKLRTLSSVLDAANSSGLLPILHQFLLY